MHTLTDLYEEFSERHGSEAPVRSREELRAAMHALGITNYDEASRSGGFWDALFDGPVPWVAGGDLPDEIPETDESTEFVSQIWRDMAISLGQS